ncbi:MAG: hypothetical protein ACE37I_10970 [Rubinisphaera brasiliensis]|uniref:hypothetical protein n=1 Tax=Rubinisphaera brasiliensis TaxID=119 RepID=UPI00391A9C75
MSAAVKLRGPARNTKVLAIADSNKATGGTGENKPVLFTISSDEGRFGIAMVTTSET